MQPITVVLAHHDSASAETLARSVEKQFLNLATAKNAEDLRHNIARLRAPLVIVDLELVNFQELGELCREFPTTAFVCTHRLADDAMWSQSLAMGAVDCCLPGDLGHVLQASHRYIAIKEAHAIPAA
jgi:DNA-binding NarL/FixJ family response regulator